MELLVRTWNLFHGRTVPETRRAHVERMVRLVTEDRPAVLCLQEVPVWALGRLSGWSGMTCLGAVTKRALLGPLARAAQAIDARRVRSPLTGQANAVLVAPSLDVLASSRADVSGPGERRVCQVVRLGPEGSALTVVNVHLSNRTPVAERQLAELAALVAGRGSCVVAGDLNLQETGLIGFSPPVAGIDQVLVRDAAVVRGPERWPDERRRLDDVLLSDHAPVEAAMMWP